MNGIERDEVHVWRASLAQPADVVAAIEGWLSGEERARAARLVSEAGRARFVVGRAIQRAVLAGYVGAAPAALSFSTGSTGKPRLRGPAAASGLSFNVSNSADMAVCAVGVGRAVGVDIERVRPVIGARRIARRLFTAEEVAALDATPAAAREAEFLRCWCRREARLKAVGGTLWDDPAGLERTAGAAGLGQWPLVPLEVGAGYVGALVIEGGGPIEVRVFDWHGPRLD